MTEIMRKFLNFCDTPEIAQLDSEDERLDEFMADFNLAPNSPEIISLINELLNEQCAKSRTAYSYTGVERDPLTQDAINDPEGD